MLFVLGKGEIQESQPDGSLLLVDKRLFFHYLVRDLKQGEFGQLLIKQVNVILLLEYGDELQVLVHHLVSQGYSAFLAEVLGLQLGVGVGRVDNGFLEDDSGDVIDDVLEIFLQRLVCSLQLLYEAQKH